MLKTLRLYVPFQNITLYTFQIMRLLRKGRILNPFLATHPRRQITHSPITNELERLLVFAFGCGSHGVLGQGQLITNDEYEPVQVHGLPPDIIGVGCGAYHSLAWSSDGQLFSWGRNKELQLGRPLAAQEVAYAAVTPSPVPVLNAPHHPYEIAYATGSGVATFAIDKRQGQLLVCGTSKRGQLGLGADVAQVPTLTPIPHLTQRGGHVTSVSAGWGHAVAVVEDGTDTRVYSWGWPANGRLGHSFAESEDDESEEALYRRCVREPREIEMLRGVKISSVTCGMDSTYFITQDGRLLSLGDNSLGQLGRTQDAEKERRDPGAWEVHVGRESNAAKDVKFKRVGAGLGHVVATTVGGNVLSFGWNTAAQLGLGEPGEDAETVYQPTFIFGVSNCRTAKVAAGRTHSVLINDDIVHEKSTMPTAFGLSWPCLTMCHTWGSAANGRLGTGTYEDAPFPELLPSLDGELLLDVACGMDHTLVLVGHNAHSGGPLTGRSSSAAGAGDGGGEVVS